MLILWPHRLSFAPWFQTMFRVGVVAVCATSLFLGFISVFIWDFTHTTVCEGAAHVPSWDFCMIDKGLIALRDHAREAAPSLLHTLAVRAKNSRPDTLHNPSSPQMLLEIKGSSHARAVANGQKLFLHWEPSHVGEKVRNGPPAPLNWSTEASCFSLTPFVFPGAEDAGAVFFKASLTDEEGKNAQEIPFLIEAKRHSNVFSDQKEPWLESLQSAQFWTKDLFFDVYGQRGSKESAAEVKISLAAKEGIQILCAKEGDFLAYQDEGWVVSSLEMATDLPLAKILKQEEGRLTLRVWDSSGFNSKVISLLPAPTATIESKIEADFLSPRLRNNAEVSCLLGKRRVVLKPGDWWLKEGGRSWRRLKRINEIDDFLAFKCKGELFVIDSLDKIHGSSSVLKGRLFDFTRQSMQIISLAVAEGRTKAATVKHHHPRSSSGAEADKNRVNEALKKAPIPLAHGREEGKR